MAFTSNKTSALRARSVTALALLVALVASVAFAAPALADYSDSSTANGWEIDGTRVFDITRIGDTIYMGGTFDGVFAPDGTPSTQANIAAFDALTGAFVPAFAPAINGNVETVEPNADGTVLFVGGEFTQVNGVTRNALVALDPATGATIASFPAHGQTGDIIFDIEVDGNDVYIGGAFQKVGGVTAPRLARIDALTGVTDASFQPGPNAKVDDIAIPPSGTRLYAVGKFTEMNGVFTNAVAGLDIVTGDVDPTFATSGVTRARSIDVTEDRLVIGNNAVNRLWVYDGTGVLLNFFTGNGDFQDVEIVGSRALIGSHSTELSGIESLRLHAVNLSDATMSTTLDTKIKAWPGVYTIYASGSQLWIGGGFFKVGSTFTDRMAIVEPDPTQTPPTTVTGLSATGLTTGDIELSWTASTSGAGLQGYRVLRGGNQVGFVTAGTSWVDTAARQGMSYEYHVEAVDIDHNISPRSSGVTAVGPVTDTSPPTAPTGLLNSSATTTTLGIDWTASTDDNAVISYEIFRDSVSVGTVDAATLTFVDSGLTAETTYTYTVQAADAAGNPSALSAPLDATTLSGASLPTAPTAVTVVAQTATTVDLSWTASTDDIGIVRYEILRDGVIVGTVDDPATTFSDTGLEPSTAYDYTVQAIDIEGNTGPASSPAATATTSADVVAPSAPGAATLDAATETSIALTWAPSTDNHRVAYYEVYRDGVLAGTTVDSTPSLVDDNGGLGLSASTSYSYTMRAFDESGNVSADSVPADLATIDTTTPSAPTGLSSTGETATTTGLQWTDSTDNVGVTSYEVLRDGVVVGTSPTSDFGDVGLTPGTTYSYEVRALDAAGNVSALSTALSISTVDDAIDPVVSVSTPANLEIVTSGPVSFSGSATDDVAVADVRIAIKNRNPGDPNENMWLQPDLTTWGDYFQHPTTVDTPGAMSTTWATSISMPAGEYGFSSVATDLAGNVHKVWTKFSTIDGTPETNRPVANIDTPVDGAILTGGTHSFAGSASDDSGVAMVQILIRDTATNQFLRIDGSFGSYQRLPTTLGTPGGTATTWAATYDLPPGTYWVKVIVTDIWDNENANPKPKHNFTVS